ncbi:Conserved_hypothetical protein [Hexamita inflata]|uniref:Uncharacterized protein n=1 Tax=Hexamita inflata TaxID=28002 RepID=A0AA86TKW5_9EUKA|nr:Conserved hypothetical protein [Hexamita inflata]CAI9928049.1 Conserved hypothetical protein [Hexamita inflata]CAI9930047.1 Conserved hypothetical protein [Hexamita inflata]
MESQYSILELVQSSSSQTKELLSSSTYGRQLLQLSEVYAGIQSALLCLQIPPTVAVKDISSLFTVPIESDPEIKAIDLKNLKTTSLQFPKANKSNKRDIGLLPQIAIKKYKFE